MGLHGGREDFGLLSDTMTSIARLSPWDFIAAYKLREVGINLVQTSLINDSVILSCATIDMNCKACCFYSIFALQKGSGLHRPDNIAI